MFEEAAHGDDSRKFRRMHDGTEGYLSAVADAGPDF